LPNWNICGTLLGEMTVAVHELPAADLWSDAAATTRPVATPSLHGGHRERLRARAVKGGLAPLPDYELLELYLFRSIPMRDVKPLAKALLARFAGLSGVLAATPAELKTVPGVGATVALDLKLLHEAALRVALQPVIKRTVISSWSALLAYIRTALAHEAREQFRLLFLDHTRAMYETLECEYPASSRKCPLEWDEPCCSNRRGFLCPLVP
jgi:hypothetical protein